MWLKEGFKEILENCWYGFNFSSTYSSILVAKLKSFKDNLKMWNKEVFNKVEVRKILALRQASFGIAREYKSLVGRLEVWPKEGDKSTSFFH